MKSGFNLLENTEWGKPAWSYKITETGAHALVFNFEQHLAGTYKNWSLSPLLQQAKKYNPKVNLSYIWNTQNKKKQSSIITQVVQVIHC